MYVGYLNTSKALRYTRIGTHIPCLPNEIVEGLPVWSYKSLFYTGVDVHVDLSGECFVGSVTLPLAADAKIFGFEVLSDGKVVGKYSAETGKSVGGTLTATVGVLAKALIIRIHTDLADLSFSAPEIAICREDGVPLLWPTVKNVTKGQGHVRIASVSAASDNEDEESVVRFLGERLAEKFGNCITPAGVPVTVKLANEGYEDERYTVEVTGEGIVLTAASRISLMYAACKLLQLGENGAFGAVTLDDKPSKPLRGFHMFLPAADQLEYAKRLFRYVLLPLGYNTLFVQFSAGMRFDRHPEIAEAWIEGNKRAEAGLQPPFPHAELAGGRVLEKWQVRDLLSCAREYGFEIVPEVQSLGHVQYITYAHPELAEREEKDREVSDTRGEDERPANFYSHCYCPSNEESYKLIFDIIDEVVEVAQPKHYVHIGHDEVYHLGLCPRCKGTSHDVLYARHVNRLYDYLKSKGLGTALWSDMIQPVTKYQTPNAINLIPKDVLCLDFIWYFHLDKDIESNLLDAGYTVGTGNLYSSHYPRYEKRMVKDGMIGGELSLWCAVSEYAMGKKGKLFDLFYTAQLLRNPEEYAEKMRRVYSHLIAKNLQPAIRDEIRGKYVPNGYSEKAFALPAGNVELPPSILAYRPEAIVADGSEVTLGTCCDRLLLEHTTLFTAPRIAWKPLYVCGEYVIRYEDGEELTAPAEYMGNVQHYNFRYGEPFFGKYYRHTGYVGTWFSDPTLEEKYNGEDVLLTSFVWENPHPEKKIASVSYRAAEGDYTTVVLTGVKALSKK